MRPRLAETKPEAGAADLAPTTVAAAGEAANSMLPTEAEVLEMISEAAYYRAEKRSFSPGLEHDDWLQAEAEVMERLRTIHGRT
jgi:hypothetical protein